MINHLKINKNKMPNVSQIGHLTPPHKKFKENENEKES